ncbi:MAG: response regulator [Deltaproteobacteria bacterium]|nr:response regulator [Deltaproteobacteria bacterium]
MRDLSKCSVLVVDDTETNVDILVDILGDDYEVRVAMDGPGALETVAMAPPDLILLDIMMPGMDGHEVCRKLKADNKTKNIPIIFVTALQGEEDEANGFALGAVDYITKPFRPATVTARVKTHLELKLSRQDLEKQNEWLKEHIRIKEEVERITHHDLKTPLSAMISVPGMIIKEQTNLTPEQIELLQMLEETGYRMLDMINSTLDLYKMETGQYQPQLGPVDLLKLVNEIRGETRELIQSKNLSVVSLVRGRSPLPADSFIVQGEEMLLYSILANILKNAVEASPAGEKVRIAFDDRESQVMAINNRGVVPEEVRERFFEKYVTSGKPGGTGLGTYSARLMAAALGAEIRMESSEKSGTTLLIKFPRPTDTPAAIPAVIPGAVVVGAATYKVVPPISVKDDSAQTASPDGQFVGALRVKVLPGAGGMAKKSGRDAQLQALGVQGPSPKSDAAPVRSDSGQHSRDIRILVVDDSLMMRQTIKGILRQMGFNNIVLAANGEQAKLEVDKEGFDLIVSDWNMPNMTGIELLKYIRSVAQLANTPFIILTGEIRQENVLEAIHAKVNEYILKPFTPDLLRKKIMRVMKK